MSYSRAVDALTAEINEQDALGLAGLVVQLAVLQVRAGGRLSLLTSTANREGAEAAVALFEAITAGVAAVGSVAEQLDPTTTPTDPKPS